MVRADEYELAREQIWLQAVEDPDTRLTQAQLAALVGKSQGEVSRRLARARANRPELSGYELIEVMAMTNSNGCDRHHEITITVAKKKKRICLACGMSAPFKPPAQILEKEPEKRKFLPNLPGQRSPAPSSVQPESE